MDYPIWDLAMGGGVLIGTVSILHVVVSHFAIGGGIALALLETLSVRRRDRSLRDLAKRGSLMLILVSTVFGAISGVGIWFTIGLVQPAATSALIHNFVWGWAAEWAFFILEVVTALLYYATWDKVRPKTHLLIIWLYAFAAFFSLVIIQGILAFMLTPGRWLETHSFWDGVFNPTYAPGLVLRTGVCLLLAGAYLTLAALREPDGDARARAVRLLAGFEAAGVLLAAGGYLWWEAALPDSARRLFRGAKPLLLTLSSTRRGVLWALLAFGVLALLALLRPRLQNAVAAAVALLLGFGVLGGYERLREGCRKPFVISGHMFSNGVLVSEIADLDEKGILSKAAWAAVASDGTPASMGRAVFRAQCASCHTLDGYQSIRGRITGVDADTLTLILTAMRDDGPKYRTGTAPPGEPPKLDYPLMPPFVGTEQELEATVAYLMTLQPAEAGHAK